MEEPQPLTGNTSMTTAEKDHLKLYNMCCKSNRKLKVNHHGRQLKKMKIAFNIHVGVIWIEFQLGFSTIRFLNRMFLQRWNKNSPDMILNSCKKKEKKVFCVKNIHWKSIFMVEIVENLIVKVGR